MCCLGLPLQAEDLAFEAAPNSSLDSVDPMVTPPEPKETTVSSTHRDKKSSHSTASNSPSKHDHSSSPKVAATPTVKKDKSDDHKTVTASTEKKDKPALPKVNLAAATVAAPAVKKDLPKDQKTVAAASTEKKDKPVLPKVNPAPVIAAAPAVKKDQPELLLKIAPVPAIADAPVVKKDQPKDQKSLAASTGKKDLPKVDAVLKTASVPAAKKDESKDRNAMAAKHDQPAPKTITPASSIASTTNIKHAQSTLPVIAPSHSVASTPAVKKDQRKEPAPIAYVPPAATSETVTVDTPRAIFSTRQVMDVDTSWPQKPGLAAAARAAESATIGVKNDFIAGKNGAIGRLARITAYWAAEGDYYTSLCLASTGIHLHGGHCAVDPSIIPYGSVVEIPGFGQFLAVDTGSAVVSRTAAREAGHTSAEKNALVVDLFFESRIDGEKFAASGAKFISISWWTPSSTENDAKVARGLFAEEDWNKIYSKQL
jgi:hypothetical protein